MKNGFVSLRLYFIENDKETDPSYVAVLMFATGAPSAGPGFRPVGLATLIDNQISPRLGGQDMSVNIEYNYESFNFEVARIINNACQHSQKERRKATTKLKPLKFIGFRSSV